MPNKSPLTKEQLIKDNKKGSLLTKIFITVGLIMVVFGVVMTFVFHPLFGLLFVVAFGALFVYLPSKARKKEKEDLLSIKNDDFQIFEDRILEKKIKHNVSMNDDDSDSYYICGIKTDKNFYITEKQYDELKTGDFFYYGCISRNRVTQEYMASEWYVDPSLQAQFIPWTQFDEDTFEKKRAEIEAENA